VASGAGRLCCGEFVTGPREDGVDSENQQGMSVPTDPEELAKLVHSRPWFHTMDLGDGIVTPGVDNTPDRVDLMGFPDSLAGKSVLDIGSYDGYFAFEAERRGASRVLATDWQCWNLEGMGDGVGFEIARAALHSRVEKLPIGVEDISPQTVGVFDVVLFLGVLYHAQDPMQYLRNVFSVCQETVILETHFDGSDYDRPMMVFYPKDTLMGDPSNFWGPNPACVEHMLYEVGFRRVEFISTHLDRLVVHAHR
jgi:tRNA (mo5U34)-methyltransferase